MTIACPTLELVYYDVPKVACTSLKTLFWEINHDRPFRRPLLRTLESQVLWRLNVALPVVHRAEGYLTTSFAASGPRPQGYESFVVVRDPIARLRSAWRDKVSKKAFGEHDELDEMRNELLPSHPDFGTFLNYYDEYRQLSKPARQHTRELTWHLGPDLAVHDHVFRMEELPRAVAYLSDRLGRPLALAHTNPAPRDSRSERLTPMQLDRLAEITAPDYEFLDGLYDQDRALDSIEMTSRRQRGSHPGEWAEPTDLDVDISSPLPDPERSTQ